MFPWRLSAPDLAAGDDLPGARAPLTDRCAALLVLAVLYNVAKFLFSLPLPTPSTAASQVLSDFCVGVPISHLLTVWSTPIQHCVLIVS